MRYSFLCFILIVLCYICLYNSALAHIIYLHNEENSYIYHNYLSLILNSLVIFSCFYDKRYKLIRVIGILREKQNINCYYVINNSEIKCHYKYVIYVKDSAGKNFKSMYMNILIYLHSSIYPKILKINNNYLHVLYNDNKYKRNVLCITTIKYFVSYKLLLQTLKIYYLYGITDVFLYISDENFDIKRIIKHNYINIHIIFIHNHIYMNSSFYFGQTVKYNDCLYRNMYISNYLIFTDFDELIVLNNITSFYNLFNAIGDGDIYYFRSALCPTENIIENKNFHILNDVDLNKAFDCCLMNSYFHRKYIIKSPSKFIKINIHHIDYCYDKIKQININESYAYIHHTRIPTFILLKQCEKWFYDIPLYNILNTIK